MKLKFSHSKFEDSIFKMVIGETVLEIYFIWFQFTLFGFSVVLFGRAK